ncbi:winged helix DNA-binding domain-containing protein, partial [bacterium]|nr:winged helix DNA-binding domain-containing protein [bacterium]
QRIYDLTERVLPDSIDTTFPNERELGHFFVRRALVAYGVAEEKEIKNHIHAVSRKIISKSLLELAEDGEVVSFEIAGSVKPSYALAKTLEKSSRRTANHSSVAILSPFDNLIIQRERTKRLFDFDYSLECYLPAPKRRYGYFVLPILWGERLVGRLDPKADHNTSTLIIRNLVFEKTFEDFETFFPAFASKLAAFAEFNRCKRIKVEKVKHGKIKRDLTRALKEAH